MKTSKVFVGFISLFVIGMLIAVANFYFKSSVLDTIAVCGVTFSIVPLVLWQFLLSANISALHMEPDSCPKFLKILFYGLFFPLFNALFITGLNVLFGFLPMYRIPKVGIDLNLMHQNQMELLFWVVVMYLILNGAGLIVRKIKSKQQVIA